jgi:hypothetical protein
VELPIDQVRRPIMRVVGDCGPWPLPAQRTHPALGSHQPFHRATGHIMTLTAQPQPHLPRPQTGDEPLPPLDGHQLDQLGVAAGPRRRPMRQRSVKRGRGDPAAGLTQHHTDRLDPKLLAMSHDEVH